MDNYTQKYQKARNTTYVIGIINGVMAFYSSNLGYVDRSSPKGLVAIALHIAIILTCFAEIKIYSELGGYLSGKLKKSALIVVAATLFVLAVRLFFSSRPDGVISLAPWNRMSANTFMDAMYLLIMGLPPLEFYAIGRMSSQSQNIPGEDFTDNDDE